MMTRRGQRWTDFQNRLHFGPHETRHGLRTCIVRYAGLTTAIYPILREIRPVENISAIRERGEPPHLEMRFALAGNTDSRLRAACLKHKIRIMHDSLWTR